MLQLMVVTYAKREGDVNNSLESPTRGRTDHSGNISADLEFSAVTYLQFTTRRRNCQFLSK